MNLDALEAELERLKNQEVYGMGYVPELDVLLIFFGGEVTLCCCIKDGELDVHIEAPTLQ